MTMRSKLPDVGTTIFTVMSRRAAEVGAVNLGQGFPDYPVDPRLADLVAAAMRAGHNQYAPMQGVAALQQAIAAQIERRHGRGYWNDVESAITVTLGATEAVYSAIQACIGAGDEAIVFDPAYDSYEPAIRLAGGCAVRLALQPPRFAVDWNQVRDAISPKTRLILINSPGNPSCAVLSAQDLDTLAELADEHDLVVLSDEVYEHVIAPGVAHASALGNPRLAARTIAIYSFGKSLHATGLRIGYAVAPPALTRELRKVHQFNTFTIATPFQHAIAAYLTEKPDVFSTLAPFFDDRRTRLLAAIESTGLVPLDAQGTYFQLVDYSACSALSGLNDTDAAMRLVEQGGVATIPLSPFYREPPGAPLLRLCFAKQDATLDEAGRRLHAFLRS
ncbi:MAG: methionine aminotransferase [Steroidobacteraceae bacterium]